MPKFYKNLSTLRKYLETLYYNKLLFINNKIILYLYN